MKRLFISCLVLGLLLLGMVGQQGNILTRFEIAPSEAESAIVYSYQRDYLSLPYASYRLLRAVPDAQRAAVVDALGAFVKKTVSTEQFILAVVGPPSSNEMPAFPFAPAAIADLNRQIDEARASGSEACNQITDLTRRKACLDVSEQVVAIFIQQRDAIIADTATFNEQARNNRANFAQLQADEKRQYQESIASAKANHTAQLIQRLESFVTLAASVDFDAKLKPCAYGGLQCFVNPDYEAQSGDWKRCYRAGRTYTLAAKAYAERWLTELKAQK